MRFSSFAIADMVLEEADARFAPSFRRAEDRVAIFKEYCEAIDGIAAQFGAESIDVEVDENSMNVVLSLVLPDIQVSGGSKNTVQQLIERSLCFRVGLDGENIVLTFTFPSLWEKAS